MHKLALIDTMKKKYAFFLSFLKSMKNEIPYVRNIKLIVMIVFSKLTLILMSSKKTYVDYMLFVAYYKLISGSIFCIRRNKLGNY